MAIETMEMKKTLIEKGFVVIMFVLVLVVFSFAERDSKKLYELYSPERSADLPVVPKKLTATNAPLPLVNNHQ